MTPKDEFAPAVPAGVTASGGSNSIELAWVRNTEADFRGYNVFRAEGTGMFEKIASLIEAPVFSDAKAAPGKMYRYQISAVDLAGNESARSETVTASIP
jgi:fibronectin type 3 domain-containing protein